LKCSHSSSKKDAGHADRLITQAEQKPLLHGAGGVSAIASDFQFVLASFFAKGAAILLGGLASARRMCALLHFLLSHVFLLQSGRVLLLEPMPIVVSCDNPGWGSPACQFLVEICNGTTVSTVGLQQDGVGANESCEEVRMEQAHND
jgi:hypothetical protein